jgi:hypothetical protein
LKIYNHLNSNKGSISLIGILALFSLSSFFIYFIYFNETTLEKIRNKYKFYLCVKNFNHRTLKTIERVNKINIYLKYKNLAKLTALIPGLQGIATSEKIATKLAIIAQNTEYFSYMKNFLSWHKHCLSFSQCSGKYPFENNFLKLKRKADGPAILKKREWKCHFKHGSNIMWSKFHVQGNLDLEPKLSITGTVLPSMSQ